MADTASCRQRWHSNQDDEASCWYGRHVTVREDTQLPSWVVTRGLGDGSQYSFPGKASGSGQIMLGTVSLHLILVAIHTLLI